MTRMKKFLSVTIAALALLSGGVLCAQTAQYAVSLEPFSGADVSGPFEVSFVRGAQYRALISVLEPYKDYVTCEVIGGVLNLTLDERKVPSEVKKQFRGKGTPDPFYRAVVYVPDLLRSVHLSGKAVLQDTEDLFDKARVSFELEGNAQLRSLQVSSLIFSLDMKGKSSAEFSINCQESEITLGGSAVLNLTGESTRCEWQAQGSSKLNADCKASHFALSGKGNSDASLSGRAENAVYDLSGTIEVDASRMQVSSADVKMSSVCKLSINALESLKVNLNGGSVLNFAGEPVVTIDNIRSSTMSRLKTGASSIRL